MLSEMPYEKEVKGTICLILIILNYSVSFTILLLDNWIHSAFLLLESTASTKVMNSKVLGRL